MLKIAMITGGQGPDRALVFSRIGRISGICFQVFSCADGADADMPRGLPLDRDGPSPRLRFGAINGGLIHRSFALLPALAKFRPDVIVTDGFAPAQLFAFSYALGKGVPHVALTESTEISEQTQSALHRALCRFVYSKSLAFVAASEGGQRLLDLYRVPREQCFRFCVCVDNAAFIPPSQSADKRFDFIFCGRLEPLKNPLFALDVAIQAAKNLRRKARILFVGAGSQEPQVRRATQLYPGLVDAEFTGAVAQERLPALYGSARLLLLPTIWEPWGVAANQACAAGLPVIASPYAGVADELVRDGENGFVCDLEVDLWAARAERLLKHAGLYDGFSKRSRDLVAAYTIDNAADGLIAACRLATSREKLIKERNMPNKTRPRVLIVERQLLHYRASFYNRLRGLLERDGIELQLLVGDGTPAEKKKKNEAHLDWAIRIPTHYLFGTTLCWQPFAAYAKEADLVIVMHENKIIYNLWLLFFARPKRMAFWGHGANLQSDNPHGWKELFKRWTINKVDWWFAYTESSAALVHRAGFPRERTTIVQNAVDTEEMAAFCKDVSDAELRGKRAELNLEDGPIALYLGSLYKEKRLDFLLDAAYRIRERIPAFQLLVVGAGPEQQQIEAAAIRCPWIHYLGPLQDRDKAVALVLADVMLNPGLVGLGILDSFTSGTPMFTTDCGLHSPEISYLSSGANGVMTRNDVEAYAGAVIDALREPEAIARLSRGALSSAPHYTIENMADRIRIGICSCLAS